MNVSSLRPSDLVWHRALARHSPGPASAGRPLCAAAGTANRSRPGGRAGRVRPAELGFAGRCRRREPGRGHPRRTHRGALAAPARALPQRCFCRRGAAPAGACAPAPAGA